MNKVKRVKSQSKASTQRLQNEIKFFQQHGVDGKTVVQAAKEVGVCLRTAHIYKKSQNYRQMALAHLEDSSLGGVDGTMKKLVNALDAQRPHNVKTKTTNKDGTIVEKEHIEWVPDNNTIDKALKKVIDIYGLNAPKTNVSLTVSISSDAELFAEIDKAEADGLFVYKYVEGESGFELAADPQRGSGGDFEARERTLLRDASISES